MTPKTADRLAALEQRIDRIEDEREIGQLMYRYIEACDHIHDAELIGSFFATDGVWEGGNRYAVWGRTAGREAIVAMFVDTPDVLPFTVHWLTNPRVEVAPDGERATGRWEVLQAATFGHSQTPVWVGARYDNEFCRTAEGWRIAHLRYADVFVTPFSEGWVATPYLSPFPEPVPGAP
ncbi:MAG: hypothetical protein JWM47_1139 [Acidimicrobiales bacterium]|nr:hypothetical protein [Acidimicrobiales bacterium]